MDVMPYGEDGLYVDLGLVEDARRALRTHAVAAALRQKHRGALVSQGAGTLMVRGVGESDVRAAAGAVLAVLTLPPTAGRTHEIPVIYDGVDLADCAAHLSLSVDELVGLHTSALYDVELIGFLPGFGYLGPLPERLVLPRRASPRVRVSAGTVAIAGPMTAVYPLDSPGGWNLIGRAVGAPMWNPERTRPALLSSGDRVRFVPVRDAPAAPPPQPKMRSERRGIEVVQAGVFVTVQDLGRPAALGDGIPPSGALDPQTLIAANRAVGNADDAAGLEVPLGGLTLRASVRCAVSVDGADALSLAVGDVLDVEPAPHAVRYVAVAGGIDVPPVLGSRATLVSAHLGGVGGRPLRKGDVVPVGQEGAADRQKSDGVRRPMDPERVSVQRGPHAKLLGEPAWRELLDGAWRVSRLTDRIGMRLDGARITRTGADVGLPVPMIRGAIQVTTDGTPVVLGPDHPATGGYPVLAVVTREGQHLLARLRPGAHVTFSAAP